MATYPADFVTAAEAATFIPELWSDEIIASYKANLVLAGLVTNFNHQGRKGDTFHIPAPTRGSASAKAADTAVTVIPHTDSDIQISIDQHYEYSRAIEDIAAVQALNSIREFFTDDAGYALATQVDSQLHLEAANLQGGSGATTWTGAVIGSDGTTAYNDATNNEAALADAGIRTAIQTLDDANVPMRDRFLVIPPVEKNNLLGLSRFTEQAFVGEVGMANSIRNGRIGSLYGVEVFVSTNCATADGGARIALLLHRSALALVTQVDIRVQTQYQLEYLTDLLVADTLYGTGELRDDAGIAIAVAA